MQILGLSLLDRFFSCSLPWAIAFLLDLWLHEEKSYPMMANSSAVEKECSSPQSSTESYSGDTVIAIDPPSGTEVQSDCLEGMQACT